jgi:23S rRNA (pseudouridine1915-N3)-methyltransferase
MKITLLCVGKLKKGYLKDAVDDYSKRIGKFADFSLIEVNDEVDSQNASERELDICRENEAERLTKELDKIVKPGKVGTAEKVSVVTLEIEGKGLTSEAFASTIEELGVNGVSHIVFIIGGSNGLHSSITERADIHLSFSKMTFPHQLMRVVLLEQIYRAFKIIRNEPYHK